MGACFHLERNLVRDTDELAISNSVGQLAATLSNKLPFTIPMIPDHVSSSWQDSQVAMLLLFSFRCT